ncbi:Pancreatic lipase-related protein 2 [Halotydeus destructor]|nr:Pancreatic lipase-related protein 2 [Halotydeus destructor]
MKHISNELIALNISGDQVDCKPSIMIKVSLIACGYLIVVLNVLDPSTAEAEADAEKYKMAAKILGIDPSVSPDDFEETYFKSVVKRAKDKPKSNPKSTQELVKLLQDHAKVNGFILNSTSYDNNATCEKKEERCFDGVGCFKTGEGPFQHLCLLPDDDIKEQFYLYKKGASNYWEITATDSDQIDGAKKLAILIHGWKESSMKDYQVMKDKLMSIGGYEQLVIADYRGSHSDNLAQSTVNCEYVGRRVGLFLQQAVEKRSLKPDDIYIVAHGMGTRVAHFAARWLVEHVSSNATPGRITALDPIEFLTYGPSGTQIYNLDAKFVDVIHSSAGYKRDKLKTSLLFHRFGYSDVLGHVDFFPNGGGYQAHCKPFDKVGCKHAMSKKYYIASFDTCEYNSTGCMEVDPFRRHGYCVEKFAGPGGGLRWASLPTSKMAAASRCSRWPRRSHFADVAVSQSKECNKDIFANKVNTYLSLFSSISGELA